MFQVLVIVAEQTFTLLYTVAERNKDLAFDVTAFLFRFAEYSTPLHFFNSYRFYLLHSLREILNVTETTKQFKLVSSPSVPLTDNASKKNKIN